MKKILSIVLIVFAAACGNDSGAPPADKSMTTPSDSAKIDTVKATDSIIKG